MSSKSQDKNVQLVPLELSGGFDIIDRNMGIWEKLETIEKSWNGLALKLKTENS